MESTDFERIIEVSPFTFRGSDEGPESLLIISFAVAKNGQESMKGSLKIYKYLGKKLSQVTRPSQFPSPVTAICSNIKD